MINSQFPYFAIYYYHSNVFKNINIWNCIFIHTLHQNYSENSLDELIYQKVGQDSISHFTYIMSPVYDTNYYFISQTNYLHLKIVWSYETVDLYIY